MPAVKIRFFLDLEENFSFLNRKLKEILLSKKAFCGLISLAPLKAFLVLFEPFIHGDWGQRGR
jgi:hypothetical protein